ncbi:MAG: oxygenase MpaB family protein [Solirubrobacterales bacterium]
MAASTGYFSDDSMIRVVNRERVVAFAGARTLLMQAAHPLAVIGLVGHSDALEDPFPRLERTAEVMSTIAFGSRAEADHLTAAARSMHARVRGRLPTDVGPYKKGTPYAADDPELLMWILFCIVDSGLVTFQTYVRRLTRDERQAYWDDYKIVGKLFGLSASRMPRSYDELQDYKHEMLTGGRLHVNDWARERATGIVFNPPFPLYARPLVETVNFITIAMLPKEIREQYGFAPLPPAIVRRAMVAAGAEYVKRVVVPLLPDRARFVPAARAV